MQDSVAGLLLEPWYNIDIDGKFTMTMGIRGEDLSTCTPKRYKVPVKHLQATLPLPIKRMRPIPSWDSINYLLFMNKHTHHYGLATDLYAAYSRSVMPTNDDEERRLNVIFQAVEELWDWEE